MTLRLSWPLAAGYAGFFLPAGVLLSYLPQLLAAKGLAAQQMSLIFSAVFAVKLVMGPALAWWADRARQQRALLTAAAWATVACAIGLAMSRSFALVLASVAIISVCRNYFQCMLEALATRVKDAGGEPRFGLMRGIGSASVCLGVVLFGGLWSAGAAYQQAALPVMIFASGFVLIACLRAFGGSARAKTASPAAAPPPETARPPEGAARSTLLFAGATLVIGANGVFYGTATLLLAQRGVGPAAITLLWCLAFGVEAVGFAAFERLRARLGSAAFFALTTALAVLRWTLFAAAGPTTWLVAAFALHVTSFSWLHAFCANWVRDAGSARYAVTAQAVYTACAHGIGMACAAYAAGVLLPTLGSGVYWIAVVMTCAGGVLLALRAALPGPRSLLAPGTS